MTTPNKLAMAVKALEKIAAHRSPGYEGHGHHCDYKRFDQSNRDIAIEALAALAAQEGEFPSAEHWKILAEQAQRLYDNAQTRHEIELKLRDAELDQLRRENEELRLRVAELEGSELAGIHNEEDAVKLIAELRDKLASEELRVFSVITELGGVDYEGYPISRLNYLQRIRILRAAEKQRDEAVRLLDYAAKNLEFGSLTRTEISDFLATLKAGEAR